MSTKLSQEQSSAPTPLEAALALVAARQHGLVTLAQARAAGLDNAMVTRWVKRGALHRRYRGVYMVGHPALSQEGEWLAAVLAAGDRSALARFAAAKLLQVSRFPIPLIDVVSSRRRRIGPNVKVHRCRNLDPRDITIVKGIPVTTLPRTLIDLADELPPHDLANVIHEAAYRKIFNPEATRQAIERATGRKNLHVLEEALALEGAGTKSRNESAFIQLIKSTDLPTPLVNTHVAGEEADAYWPQHALIAEVDGPGHLRATTKTDDARKDAAWSTAGLTVLRFTDKQLAQHPQAVLAALVARMQA